MKMYMPQLRKSKNSSLKWNGLVFVQNDIFAMEILDEKHSLGFNSKMAQRQLKIRMVSNSKAP